MHRRRTALALASGVLRDGPGLDTALYFESPHGVRIDLPTGRSTGRGADTLISIEGAVGSHPDDVIIGDSGSNGLLGEEGDDLIRGGGSGTVAEGTADFLSGDLGDEDLRGGPGEDLALYARIPVSVDVDLGAGTATGQGNDDLDGGGGSDTAVYADEIGPVDVGDDLLVGRDGVDLLDGGRGRDQCEDDPAELQSCESASAARRGPDTSIVWHPWVLPGRDIPPRG